MEKVIWVRSNVGLRNKVDDGLSEVNEYLEQGWTVKMISACPAGDAMNSGQAYVVLEKK